MSKVQTGQIIEFYSNTCKVLVTNKEYKCQIQGRIDLVVGDLVEIEEKEELDNSQAVVIRRLKRNTALFKAKENIKKAVAANISHIGILVTINPKTNLEFIDKWITIGINSKIQPFIIFNKIDSVSKGTFDEMRKLYKKIHIPSFVISAKYKTNLENLISYLSKQTSIFVGNSGAGKSTLTSSLTGKEILSKSLSNNQGVHTTSISTLYETVNMIKVIDSPGIRDIDINYLTNDQILKGFKEIYYLSRKCSFPNCGHDNDKGCAVIDGLKNDEIQQSRYNNFMALKKRIN